MTEVNIGFAHSILIDMSDFKFDEPLKSKEICIYPNEFELEQKKYYNFLEKASYIYTYALMNDEKCLDITNRMSRVIKDEIKKDVLFDIIETDYWENGNIDDQNKDIGNDVSFDDEKMKFFLFNKKSSIIVS